MQEVSFINSIIRDDNKCHFVREFIEGTSRWLLNTLENIDSSLDASNLRTSLEGYLKNLYGLQYHYDITNKTYRDFLNDQRTGEMAMYYIFKSIHTRSQTTFLSSIIAIKIAIERKEGDYEQYDKTAPIDMSLACKLLMYATQIQSAAC